jgi:hypothetical protein
MKSMQQQQTREALKEGNKKRADRKQNIIRGTQEIGQQCNQKYKYN